MADENNKLIDIEALSHFKAKQDLENLKKFISKDDTAGVTGAVRYDTLQILTAEQQARARANIGIIDTGVGGETTVSGSEIIVITATLNEEDEKITITEDAAEIITNYTGEKPMYLRLDPLGLFFSYITTENCFLCCLSEGFYQKITIDAENLVCHLEKVEPTHYSSGTTIGSYTLNLDGTYTPVNAEKDSVFPAEEDDLAKFVFVSDKIYTVDELLGYTIQTKTLNVSTGVVEEIEEIEITPDLVTEMGDAWSIMDEIGIPLITVITENMAGVDVGFKLPTNAGTYLTYLDHNINKNQFGVIYRVFGSVKVSNETVKKLDEKYIPDVIARKDEVPTLDANGKVPSSLLPSFVDDVVEGYFAYGYDDLFYKEPDNYSSSNLIPYEKGKIYIDLNTSNTYRWTGSQYVRINPDEYTVATNADIDALFE